MEAALTRELSNSGFVNVVPRERIDDALRLMRLPTDARIDGARAREIGLRDSDIRVVLTGQVEKLDSTYLLSAAIVDPTNGVAVAGLEQEADSQHAIIAAIRRLSIDVRGTLGEALTSVATAGEQLEQVTTPSLRALQLFSQADTLISEGRNDLAEALLHEAVADDPGFASAHMHLAWTIRNQQGSLDESRLAAQRAFDLVDTTSDRERYFILGSYHWMFDQLEESTTAYETLLRLYPDHYWGTNNLAEQYRRAGRAEESLPLLLTMGQLRPNDFESNFRFAHGVF